MRSISKSAKSSDGFGLTFVAASSTTPAQRGHDVAHPTQQDFCRRVRNRFPVLFGDPTAKILDCGSLDINGNNRYLFASTDYTGVDLGEGRNVDVVSRIHEYDAPDASFDIVITTECLEHDAFYADSLKNMLRVLKPGGLLVMTCATTGRPEHGTSRTDAASSPFTTDYYKNLVAEDIALAIPMDAFEEHEFSGDSVICDLYFWGRKKRD